MRTKAKAALISAAAIVGVAGGIWFSWCSGINYERRYKKLFNKTFKGDYKITVTESGFYTNKEAPIKLPVRYKIYDIEYKDKNGNVRNTELDSRASYYYSSFDDQSMIEYIKNVYKYADMEMMAFLDTEMMDIVKADMCQNIMPKYFDLKSDSDFTFTSTGDGYSIFLIPSDTAADHIHIGESYYNDDKVKEYISPDNCLILSDMDMKTFANTKTAYISLSLQITDESKFDMKDEYLKKVEAMIDEYSAASDFGGNYHYIVRRTSDGDTELKDLDATEVYVINGEKITFDPNEERPYSRFKEAIAEKAGYNTSEK